MAESHSKSKLKRKKVFVEDQQQPQTCSRGALSRSHTVTAVFSSDRTAEPERSVAPAVEWWNREQLPAVESLWALTLRSALPYLENQHCHLVPDLPHPSTWTVRPTALKLDDHRWCDLSEEVPAFPEPSLQRTLLSPDPLRLSSSQQDLSVQTKPVPDPPDRQMSSHSSQSHNNKTTSLQGLTKTPQPPLHSWEGGTASSAVPSSVGGEEERKEGKIGAVNRQLLTNQGRVSDRLGFLQKRDENKEEEVEDEEEEEVQRSDRGDGEAAGGGRLQSCPMCLLVFPAGFTQMDCDGHLAQCLSEVNVDVTW